VQYISRARRKREELTAAMFQFIAIAHGLGRERRECEQLEAVFVSMVRRAGWVSALCNKLSPNSAVRRRCAKVRSDTGQVAGVTKLFSVKRPEARDKAQVLIAIQGSVLWVLVRCMSNNPAKLNV
jgi:hypothetical protein